MQRTVRVEVTFPGLRDADLKEVWGNLWAMQDDLTQAANRLMGALWQRRLGQIEAEGSERTLAYRGMTGAWNPYPTLEPIYRASKVRAHSFTLSETAELVCTRLKTDYKEILRGQKTLPTFRGGHNLPLGLRATSIKLKADGSIGLCVYAGTEKKKPLLVRPRKLDDSRKAILGGLRDGTYTLGSGKLSWKKPLGRKGKWYLHLSWSDPKHVITPVQPESDEVDYIIAGVDTGIRNSAWVAYVDGRTGKPLKRPDVFRFDKPMLRAVDRVTGDLIARRAMNRKLLSVREGKGIQRKIRHTAHVEDRVARINETMISKAVAAVVVAAKKRGATLLVVEDHKEWAVSALQRRADKKTASEAATIRKTFFRRHEGRVRELLQQVGEREGLKVVLIDPAWTSRTCHSCGTLWKRDWFKDPPKPQDAFPFFGRAAPLSPEDRPDLSRFHCSCGWSGNSDHNAAVNIARKGIEVVDKEQQAAK